MISNENELIENSYAIYANKMAVKRVICILPARKTNFVNRNRQKLLNVHEIMYQIHGIFKPNLEAIFFFWTNWFDVLRLRIGKTSPFLDSICVIRNNWHRKMREFSSSIDFHWLTHLKCKCSLFETTKRSPHNQIKQPFNLQFTSISFIREVNLLTT